MIGVERYRPKAAICSPAWRIPSDRIWLMPAAMEMLSGIAETKSRNDPSRIAQLCCVTKAEAVAES
jgi:hypothetical protein